MNLAVVACRRKQRVLLLDLDPQHTSESWYQQREDEYPLLVTATANDIPNALARARNSGIDWTFIDTPGRDDPAIAAAIKHSDYCLLPCRPSPADMKAIPPTVTTVTRLAKPFAFVLTQTPPCGPRIREARTGLAMLGTVATTPIVTRAVYQDAQGAGLGVVEFAPKSKAATEITSLWQWLNRQVKKLADD